MANSRFPNIVPLRTFGVMTVYRRRGSFFPLTKYFVGHADGRNLEDFHSLRNAEKFASENRNG